MGWNREMELLACVIACDSRATVDRPLRDRMDAALRQFDASVYPPEWAELVAFCRDWLLAHRDRGLAPALGAKALLIAACDAMAPNDRPAPARPMPHRPYQALKTGRRSSPAGSSASAEPAPHFAWQDRADCGDRP